MLSRIDPIGAVSVQWINDQQTKKSLSDYDTHGSVRIYCVRNSCFINSVITCSAEPVNFITHFLSPEQDLCTSTSALRIHHFFPVPCLSLVAYGFTAICLGRDVWATGLLEYYRLALEAVQRLCPPAWLLQLRHIQASGGRKSKGQLCLLCIGAFFKQRITMLYAVGVNSMGFGGRSGAASWLFQLASYVNPSASVALCVRGGEGIVPPSQ